MQIMDKCGIGTKGRDNMEYKLNPEIGKILSPVTIIWNGMAGNRIDSLQKVAQPQTWRYENGQMACNAVFDKKLNVIAYKAVENQVEITAYEFCEPNPKRNG